jgi:CRP/FNR family transcriptional regulator
MRVQQVSESGREVVLYRVSGGESCALTISCFFSQETYHAEGIAETPIKAVAIGRAAFDDLIVQSEEFRRLVFSAFSARLVDLFHVIDDIVFSRLDIRLAQKLLQMADGACEIRATHQQLAVELGSAREVISRLLNEFQGRGWVKNSRGLILITNEQALRRLSTLQ